MAGRKMREYVCEECGAAFQSRGVTPRFCSKSCATTAQHRGNVRPAFVCERCGASFTVPPSEAQRRTRRFCSKTCYAVGTGRGEPVERRCEQCGAPFMQPAYTAKSPASAIRFCSIACCNLSHIGVKRLPLRRCRHCGKNYYPVTERLNRLFCSRDCHITWKSAHALWYRYYGPNWPEQRAKARARDDDTCQDCGIQRHTPALDVHHVRPRRLFAGDHEAANDLTNLVTLCRGCHRVRDAAEQRAFPLY